MVTEAQGVSLRVLACQFKPNTRSGPRCLRGIVVVPTRRALASKSNDKLPTVFVGANMRRMGLIFWGLHVDVGSSHIGCLGVEGVCMTCAWTLFPWPQHWLDIH